MAESKNGHVGQQVPNGDRIYVRLLGHSRRVGNQGELLVGWELERLIFDFVPNDLVDPLRVAFVRREEVDDQDVDALAEKVESLLDE